ncbi:MAG: hypothetical protein H0V53_10540 [Rubrobacter sp.]|nr:hypothetical protein [Rubrobacter sp.]
MSDSRLFSSFYDPLMELPENLGLEKLRRESLREVRRVLKSERWSSASWST